MRPGRSGSPVRACAAGNGPCRSRIEGSLAPGLFAHVNRDRDRDREAGWQRPGQLAQRGQAACAPADHHHITRFHDLATTRPAARHSPAGSRVPGHRCTTVLAVRRPYASDDGTTARR